MEEVGRRPGEGLPSNRRNSLTHYLDGRVEVLVGDITRVAADAIVNAANSSLLGGGGVDGAIHRAGGPEIDAACRKLRETGYPRGLPAGQAVATTAGNLPSKCVIHTVGPVWHGGNQDEPALLRDCYLNALAAAVENGCRSIAFPAISTGIYGYPKTKAATVSSQAVKTFLSEDRSIERVQFIFFSREDAEIFICEQRF